MGAGELGPGSAPGWEGLVWVGRHEREAVLVHLCFALVGPLFMAGTVVGGQAIAFLPAQGASSALSCALSGRACVRAACSAHRPQLPGFLAVTSSTAREF